MKTGPDIALVAALLGDPARANMLTALMDDRSLTAGELARHAGVTPQTASSHLAKLQSGGLIEAQRQGRHSYFTLADTDVAAVLEGLMGLAARAGHKRLRTGPKEPALRQARVCYDHLAGDAGVALFDGLLGKKLLAEKGERLGLTAKGEVFMRELGIELDGLGSVRRPLCKSCLDWSVRRSHLAGALGAALLERLYALKWARREDGTRIVAFTPRGRAAFEKTFGPIAAH
ncbi:MAG: winged helix-turn-helix domain-containing protein [Rhodospirillales bacterium]